MSIQKNTPELLDRLGLSYTVIINQTIGLIKDASTLGIFLYLSSKPHNWVIQEKDLMNRFGKGRDFIRTRLKDLRDVGLLKAHLSRGKKGHISGWTTTLYSHVPPEGNPESSSVSKKAEQQNIDTNQNTESSGDTEVKKSQAKTRGRVTEKPKSTTTLGNRPYTNTRGSLQIKDTTTTEKVVVISENIDEQIMALRNEHMPNDERTPEEFISQCKWHLDKGDQTKYNFYQRFAGLRKLIQSQRFITPAGYKSPKKAAAVNYDRLMSSYMHYFNSDIEKALRKQGRKSKTFDQWKTENAA